MSVGSLLKAKKVINSFSRKELECLLNQALSLRGARLVRERYTQALDSKNLGGLIRAGK